LNQDGSLDESFSDPNVSGDIHTLVIQSDGRALIGGDFTNVSGLSWGRIARLNADGCLDTSFNPIVNGAVTCIQPLADLGFVIGGSFTVINNVTKSFLAKLNHNGTLDADFSTGTNGTIYGLALDVDRRILVAGDFTTIGGMVRERAARLNADGSVDPEFDPRANGIVRGFALQADGAIIAGGDFTTIGGVTRNRIARLANDVAATQTLMVTGTNQIDWVRGGSAPEIDRVTFEAWNGSAWVGVGSATRVAGGWRGTGLTLSAGGWVRARGVTLNGQQSRFAGIMEQVVAYGNMALPEIVIEQPPGSSLVDGSSTVSFGTSNVAVPRIFTVRNAGTAPLSGLALSADGLNQSDFVVGDLDAVVLQPGETTTFTVTFLPKGSGHREAELHLSSNDQAHLPFDIRLQADWQNTPPVISAIANQQVQQGTSTGPISFTVGDGELPADYLTVTGTSSNPVLVPNSGIALSGTGASRSVRPERRCDHRPFRQRSVDRS
jgi:uncharacterized delta-60 repeat protein